MLPFDCHFSIARITGQHRVGLAIFCACSIDAAISTLEGDSGCYDTLDFFFCQPTNLIAYLIQFLRQFLTTKNDCSLLNLYPFVGC